MRPVPRITPGTSLTMFLSGSGQAAEKGEESKEGNHLKSQNDKEIHDQVSVKGKDLVPNFVKDWIKKKKRRR